MEEVFDAFQSEKFLKRYIPVSKNQLVKSMGEIKIKTPLVLKIISKDALHKTEINGVRIIKSNQELESNFKDLIKTANKKKIKLKAGPDNVLVSCGSQEAIFSALLTTIDPTEQVILPTPGYLGYLPAIELVNGIPKYLKLEEKDKFEINPDNLKKSIDKKKTKVLIINSPSNPTGNVLSKKVLEEIADIAVDNNLYVFSDEAYEQLTYDRKHISMASLNGMKNHVVSFQTFSKSFAMCGFRLGYAVGPKKLIQEMTKVHHYVTLTAPHLSQLVGVKALSLSKKYVNSIN